MMSQPGWQTMAIHILPNISRSKGNQTLKFGQVIEYNRNIFLPKLRRKWGRKTSSRPLLFFKKALYQVKQVVCSLVSITFNSPQLAKQKIYIYISNFRILIQKYAQFWFFRKGYGNGSSTTFCVWFSRKMLIKL